MKTFYEFNHQKNSIDSSANFMGNDELINNMLVFLSRNRDSGLLDNSNFESGLKALGGESKEVQVHRFGHWACGWFELILIEPTANDKIALCEDMLNALSDYPVIDENDYYTRESEATFNNEER